MIKKLLALAAVVAIVAVGLIAYLFFKTPEAASEPIEAIPINVDLDEATQEEAVAPADATTQESDTVVVIEEAQAGEAEAETDPAPAYGEQAAVNEAGPAAPIIFEIVPAESQARFSINEVLRGEPTTVVGVTDQVAGQFALTPADLSTTQVGVVQVNARTLATNNNFRNRAIKNRILLTDDYEFVTFTPKEVVGLPETGKIGETYTFQVVGDLTVTDATRPVTLEVTAAAVSETRIEGKATTAFPYTDFELFIPEVDAVDAVDDEVRLEVDFVAAAVR